jgi:hypothetical protein
MRSKIQKSADIGVEDDDALMKAMLTCAYVIGFVLGIYLVYKGIKHYYAKHLKLDGEKRAGEGDMRVKSKGMY